MFVHGEPLPIFHTLVFTIFFISCYSLFWFDILLLLYVALLIFFSMLYILHSLWYLFSIVKIVSNLILPFTSYQISCQLLLTMLFNFQLSLTGCKVPSWHLVHFWPLIGALLYFYFQTILFLLLFAIFM